MRPNDPQNLDFSLDDIIKEFSSQILDEILAEVSETPKPSEPQTPAPAESTEETVRLETVATEPLVTAQDTMAFTPISQETVAFTPAAMPELAPEPEPEPEPELSQPITEPYSEEWEPDYEEPMGDYPNPIHFPSKNRQTILRKKLVSGPEKRYHDLASEGLGRLQFSIFLHLVLLAASAAITVIFTLRNPNASQMRLMLFGQLVIGMLTGLLGCYRLLVGIGSLMRGRFTLNTLLLIAFIACMVDSFFCLSSQRMPFTTLLCLDIFMAQVAEYQRRNTQISQMDTLRKALEITAVVKVPNYYEGLSGYVTTEGDPDDFMKEYYKPTAPERRLELFGLIALLVSAGITVYVGMVQSWGLAIQVLSAALLAAIPASSLIIISRPIAVLEKRMHRLGTVLCGWKGVRNADQKAVYPLDHKDLFPTDCAKMNGVKFYGSVDPGRVVAYSTALIAQDGEGMMKVFAHLPRSRHIDRYHVTDFMAYPGGITGLVDGWGVMVGTYDFMNEMGVTIPNDAKISHAVYAAVDGQFSAVFALHYQRSKSSTAGIRTLCGYRNIKAVLTACDFILTDRFIRGKLGVNVNRMVFPEREVRQELAATPIPQDATVVALTVKSGLASKAYALTGARALRSTLNIGSIVHIFAGVVGLVAVVALTFAGAQHMLSVQNLLAYSLVWMVPGLLITGWTRYI